jgi:shikimate kinase
MSILTSSMRLDSRKDAGVHLYLIGFRTAGKSTVGRLVAERLGLPFVDTDRRIESVSGCSIAELFAERGEPEFRLLEERVIAEVAREEPSVVALGGGAILSAGTRAILARTGRTVWLQVTAEQAQRRMGGDPNSVNSRPSLTSLSGYDEIVSLLAAREPLYAECGQKSCCAAERTPEAVAEEVMEWYRQQQAAPG